MRRKIFLLFPNILAILGLIIFSQVNSYSKSLAPGDAELWSNIRFRYEIQNNFNLKAYGGNPVVGEEDDNFLLGRFRAGFKYRPFESILLSAGIQHSDVWDNALDDSSFFQKSFNREHNSYNIQLANCGLCCLTQFRHGKFRTSDFKDYACARNTVLSYKQT